MLDKEDKEIDLDVHGNVLDDHMDDEIIEK